MNINKELQEKINNLPPDISDLVKEMLSALEKGKGVQQIEELILGNINEIISQEDI